MPIRTGREVDTHERWLLTSRCFGPTDGAHTFKINPNTVRQALDEVSHRGGDVTALLDGLGFDRHDLSDPFVHLPYATASEAIRRAVIALDDPDIGLMIGMRHHIVSWGFVGLGAMACSDLNEALAFGIRHQVKAGSMLALQHHIGDGEVGIVAHPRFADVSIERVLVDCTFVALLNAVRFISGPSLRPVRVELVATQVASRALYAQVFQCPVHFSCPVNYMAFDRQMVDEPLRTADMASKNLAQSIIGQRASVLGSEGTLRAMVEDQIRSRMANRPRQAEIAELLGMHERTLRRQLRQEGCNYKGIVEQQLRTCSLEQIVLARRPPEVVAEELGFSSVAQLSQAYKQWTGLALKRIKIEPDPRLKDREL
jgi:AraC-like DNA-binding protein